MGKAELWQDKVLTLLKDYDVIIANPRRDNWDPSWVQSIQNIHFKQQVLWELEQLESSDMVLFYLDKNTKSPITLLELGLFARKAVVCCPDGFYRKGNVDIVCEKYNIPCCNTLDDLVQYSIDKLRIKKGKAICF